MYDEREPWRIRKEYDTRYLLRLREARERADYLKKVERYRKRVAEQKPAPGDKRPLDEAPDGPDQPAKVRAGGSSPSYATAVSTPLSSTHSPLAASTRMGPFYVGVVGRDGKTTISAERFAELAEDLSDAFGDLLDKNEVAPTIAAIFPAGLERVGVEFRGWELVDQVSLDILDKMVKEASQHEFQVLTTTEIKKNKREILYQAPLGRLADKTSLLVNRKDERLKKFINENRSLNGVGGRVDFVRTFEKDGVRYLLVQLDEGGLASLRKNEFRLQMNVFGILAFEPYRPPAPQSSRRGSGQGRGGNKPNSAMEDLADAAALWP